MGVSEGVAVGVGVTAVVAGAVDAAVVIAAVVTTAAVVDGGVVTVTDAVTGRAQINPEAEPLNAQFLTTHPRILNIAGVQSSIASWRFGRQIFGHDVGVGVGGVVAVVGRHRKPLRRRGQDGSRTARQPRDTAHATPQNCLARLRLRHLLGHARHTCRERSDFNCSPLSTIFVLSISACTEESKSAARMKETVISLGDVMMCLLWFAHFQHD